MHRISFMDPLPKYAKLETERRWLVDPRKPWPTHAAPFRKRIHDRYLDGRLRLRRMIDPDTGDEVLKLTKKYPSPTPGSGPLVTILLTRPEYDLLATLPARDLVKVRHYVDEAGHVFCVDVFEGALTGLVTSELELDPPHLEAVASPPWTVCEITTDPFFTGGHLASTTTDDLQRRLAAAFAAGSR